MIYLDTVLCIYAVESKSQRGLTVTKLLATSQDRFCVSPLVWMECLVQPLSTGDLMLEDHYRRFLSSMDMVELPTEVFLSAARIRATTGLRTPDALHVAAAMASGCDAIWTADATMAKRLNSFAVDVFANLSEV